MANVLVVGGAGYVGSATCAWLMDHGHRVTVVDDLSTGYRELVLGHVFVRARAGDRTEIAKVLRDGAFDCAMHFAARSLIGECFAKRDEYFENNVDQTKILLDLLLNAGVSRFLFSSTCAIFGDVGGRDIAEDAPFGPANPYAETKLAVERHLQSLAPSGLNSIALRYFNAAGTEPQLRVGERHSPETHLIPLVLKAARAGREVKIFGDDYPTPDGTCIRDYIHVWDLAHAHEAAMNRLLAANSGGGGQYEAFNLGSESGYSVRDVVRMVEEVTGLKIRTQVEARRAGDVARLVANAAKAKRELGFNSRFGLREIVSSAWQWENIAGGV